MKISLSVRFSIFLMVSFEAVFNFKEIYLCFLLLEFSPSGPDTNSLDLIFKPSDSQTPLPWQDCLRSPSLYGSELNLVALGGSHIH